MMEAWRAWRRMWLLLQAAWYLKRGERVFMELTADGWQVIHPWTKGQGSL